MVDNSTGLQWWKKTAKMTHLLPPIFGIYWLIKPVVRNWEKKKSRDITLPTKVRLVKAMFFPVVMYGCERWTIKKLSTKELMLLNYGVEESPLDCKKVKPVNSKGSQPRTFIGRTDAEAETPILWPPDAKNKLIRKRPWCWERLKAGGEGDDRGWDCWMASPPQWTWVWVTPGVGDGQGSLVCCRPWGSQRVS